MSIDPDRLDLERWESDGGSIGPKGPVTAAQVLATLDLLAARVPGHPIASRRAADLAAAIRVRGLAP